MEDDSFSKNNDPDFKGIHRPLSKVLIDKEASYVKNEDTPENVEIPIKKARIITINGEIWETILSAFLAHDNFVKNLWDQKPSLFKKLDIT